MTDGTRIPVPGWYWAVAVLALLWEALGCYMYVWKVTVDAAGLAAMPAAERDALVAMPVWATAAYAVAVWTGLLGAVGLLLRKRWARLAFITSLLGIIVQFSWWLFLSPVLSTIGASAAAMPAFVFIVGLALVWFSELAIKRGWLS
jgi:hypothetical protein